MRRTLLFLMLCLGVAASAHDARADWLYTRMEVSPAFSFGPAGESWGTKSEIYYYLFREDGYFEHGISHSMTGSGPLQGGEVRGSGTYEVEGSRVILKWSRGSQSVGLLTDAGSAVEIDGQAYELSANAFPDAEPGQGSTSTGASCRGNCGELFTNCNIAGHPYSYCSEQNESCMAACR